MWKSVGFGLNIYCSEEKKKNINHSTSSFFVRMENDSNKFFSDYEFHMCAVCVRLADVENRSSEEKKKRQTVLLEKFT